MASLAMLKKLEVMLFHLESSSRITSRTGNVSLFTDIMVIKCARPQKFRLEIFRDINEGLPPSHKQQMIRFRVLSLGGRIDLNMEVYIPEANNGSVYISSGWVKVKAEAGLYSGSFDLLTAGELSYYKRKFVKRTSDMVDIYCKVKIPPAIGIGDFEDKVEGRSRLGDDLAKARVPSAADAVPFSDVTLICQGRSFAAHKVLLAARSDVFAAMFSHEGTLEASTGSVEIVDLESGTVDYMLQFLYADQLKGVDVSFESACKLLAAANKYNIAPLATVCELLISSGVDVHTAVPALKVAHFWGSDSLKEFVEDFAKRHLSELSQTAQWMSFFKAKDTVSKEIVRSVTGEATGSKKIARLAKGKVTKVKARKGSNSDVA